jgi:hypothetical protein
MLTPVAADIFGIIGINAGATTPSVLEKRLIVLSTRAITTLADITFKFSPIQDENT